MLKFLNKIQYLHNNNLLNGYCLTCKAIVKKYIPSIYFYKKKIELLKALPYIKNRKTSTTIIMNDREVGFFSMFFQVLGALDICKTYKHSIVLEFINGQYGQPNKNWWLCYFNSNLFGNQTNKSYRHHISEFEGIALSMYGRSLPPSRAFDLISGMNLIPKKTIIDKVDSFVLHYFHRKMIGVHYRGTDKISEAPRTEYSAVLNRMNEFKDGIFFIASDEDSFIKSAVQTFGSRVVFCNHKRSQDSAPIHLHPDNFSGEQIGEEALIDCLLLSRCQILIRTASNLSIASGFFNPQIRVIEV